MARDSEYVLELLLDYGLVSQDQVDQAKTESKAVNGSIDPVDLLQKLGFLRSSDLTAMLAQHYGMEIMERLVDGLDRHSVSVKDAGQYALDYFRAGDLMERYGKALARFEEHLPDWEIFFEHILVNHLFFSLFPFQDRPESFKDEYLSLCAIYALMRFLCLGCLSERYDEKKLIDLLAAAFRLIDHTNFECYAGKLLRAYGCEVEDVHRLLLL